MKNEQEIYEAEIQEALKWADDWLRNADGAEECGEIGGTCCVSKQAEVLAKAYRQARAELERVKGELAQAKAHATGWQAQMGQQAERTEAAEQKLADAYAIIEKKDRALREWSERTHEPRCGKDTWECCGEYDNRPHRDDCPAIVAISLTPASIRQEMEKRDARMAALEGALEHANYLHQSFWQKLSIGSIDNVMQGRINTSMWKEIGEALAQLKQAKEGA